MITVGNLDTIIEIEKPSFSGSSNYGGVQNTTYTNAGEDNQQIWAYTIFRGGGETEEGDQKVGNQRVDFFIRYDTFKDLIQPNWRVKFFNSDHPSLGEDLVQNGNFRIYGDEVLINPSFSSHIALGATGSGWTGLTEGSSVVEYDSLGIGITRDGGFARVRATTITNSTDVLSINQTYKLTYEVIQNTSAAEISFFNGDEDTKITSTVGTHTVFFTQKTSQIFQINNDTDGTKVVVDNVSLKETGQKWSLVVGASGSAGWQYTTQGIQCDSAVSSPSLETYDYVIPTGKKYRVTVKVTDMTTGSLSVNFGAAQKIGTISANGTFTFDATSTADTIKLIGDTFNGTLTEVAVQEYTDSVRYYYIDKIDEMDGRHKITKLLAIEKGNNEL
jgi:hypothetical protein